MIRLKISIKEMSYLAIVFFFSVALNPDWSSNPLLWWTSFFSVLIFVSASNDFKICLKIDLFKIWLISFGGISLMSIIYALNSSNSITVIKTFTLLFIILFLLDDQLNSSEDLEKYVKLFLISLFIMIIYVIINLDLKSFQLAQHGEAST